MTALGSATSSTSATTAGSKTGYAFDRTFILGRNFWAPQFSASLAASPGRLALTASAPLVDVGAGAGAVSPRSIRASGRLCTPASTPSSSDVAVTGEACTEPTSLVLFDDNGVGTPAEHGGWTVLKQGSATVSGVSVEWEVGSYPVQGLTVYGLVCYPSAVGKHPVLIANHGLDLQNIQAGLDEASLGFCEAMASGGWLTAMSTYRGESLQLEEIADTFANGTATSDGGVELCLGEVTDVLRLTTLVLERTTVDPSRVLMWGHSHGACISARALSRAPPSRRPSSSATPTNFATFYDACAGTDSTCAYEAGIVADLTGYTPNTLQGGIAYGWRSPVSFVEDLAWRTDVKLLMLQGGADLIVHPGSGVPACRPSGHLDARLPRLRPRTDRPAVPVDRLADGEPSRRKLAGELAGQPLPHRLRHARPRDDPSPTRRRGPRSRASPKASAGRRRCRDLSPTSDSLVAHRKRRHGWSFCAVQQSAAPWQASIAASVACRDCSWVADSEPAVFVISVRIRGQVVIFLLGVLILDVEGGCRADRLVAVRDPAGVFVVRVVRGPRFQVGPVVLDQGHVPPVGDALAREEHVLADVIPVVGAEDEIRALVQAGVLQRRHQRRIIVSTARTASTRRLKRVSRKLMSAAVSAGYSASHWGGFVFALSNAGFARVRAPILPIVLVQAWLGRSTAERRYGMVRKMLQRRADRGVAPSWLARRPSSRSRSTSPSSATPPVGRRQLAAAPAPIGDFPAGRGIPCCYRLTNIGVPGVHSFR